MMGLLILVALVAVLGGVLLVVVVVAAGSRRSRANPMGYAPPVGYTGPPAGQVAAAGPYQAGTGMLPGPALTQVRMLLSRGQKIQAIKVVREETGMGLKDAKDYVEAMAAGRIPLQAPPAAVRSGGEPGGTLLSERVRAFKAAGDPVSAVALVCAETGMSQGEAERFVDALG